jgi:hypothetical protein
VRTYHQSQENGLIRSSFRDPFALPQNPHRHSRRLPCVRSENLVTPNTFCPPAATFRALRSTARAIDTLMGGRSTTAAAPENIKGGRLESNRTWSGALTVVCCFILTKISFPHLWIAPQRWRGAWKLLLGSSTTRGTCLGTWPCNHPAMPMCANEVLGVWVHDQTRWCWSVGSR